jgi:23S rRNA (guanosine2251-2'-O)-methyltransferase
MVRSIEYLKESGLKVISATEKSGTDISKLKLTGPAVLIMGAEDKGISRELLSVSDHLVKIPVTGNISSLNVSVAAGIILYEIARQRSL